MIADDPTRAILWRVPPQRGGSGPLDGVSVAVKDSIDVAGVPATNGTKFLTEPATSDAVIVQRLRAAGAVLVAKTNMHELGNQPTGINPHWGTPVNPWDPSRIPGGSSSGSAVAVASGIARMAVGTDAGGSIRIPAAFNGVVGLKPTFGAVPLDGIGCLAFDLDHAGPIARTVDDATMLFEVLAQTMIRRDATVSRVALIAELFDGVRDGVGEAVRQAARTVFGDLPTVSAPLAAWAPSVEFVIVGTDASRLCEPYMKDHARDIAPDTRIILRLGAGLSAGDRRRADRVRAAMRREIDKLLETYDVLIAPSTGCMPPRIHNAARKYGQLDTTKIAQIAGQCFVANLTGHPAVSVPCVREGLPVGMQIIGRANDEARVLAAAREVEKHFGWRQPPRFSDSRRFALTADR